MSDVDPTPDTPVTLGDRMGWWRGDMADRLTTLETQVNALAGTPAGSLAALAGELDNVRGNLVDLRGDLADLRGTSSVDLTQVHGLVSSGLFTAPDGNNQQLPWLFGLGVTAEAIKEHWNHGQGLTAYVILENIYLLMVDISRTLSVQTEGLPPTSITRDIGSVGDDIIEGRRFAIWYPPIAGVTVTGGGTNLTPVTSWEGWNVYIQSTSPTASARDFDIPTNTWVQLSGTGIRAFSVETQYPIRGYLRPPAVVARRIVSSLIGTNSNGTWYGIRWAPDPEVSQVGIGGLVTYSIDNITRAYSNYQIQLSQGVYRGDNLGVNAVYVSGTITIGAVNSMYLIMNTPFHIDITNS